MHTKQWHGKNKKMQCILALFQFTLQDFNWLKWHFQVLFKGAEIFKFPLNYNLIVQYVQCQGHDFFSFKLLKHVHLIVDCKWK